MSERRCSARGRARGGAPRRLATAALLGLVLVVACSACAGVLAVTCESYKTETDCEAKVTSEGKCGWSGGALACVVAEPLGDGGVGVTGGPDGADSRNPTESLGGVLGEGDGSSSSAATPGTRAFFMALVGAVALFQLL
ncbi:hypothetical protein HOP50_11g64980 [Chloropicon primus]|nr:hypothetical protein HOP50_11g64980 [Chloropicon primus]